MTNEQIALVRANFLKVKPVAQEAAVLLYARLFELDPDLRRLFRTDIALQGRKLMQMIEAGVDGLDRLDELVPAVRALGARHHAYGVEERHYETVGAALIWTLEEALGKDFTADAKAAWTDLYQLLSEAMRDGAREQEADARSGR